MKILNAEQFRELDAYTIAHEPIRSIDLMERAASKCFDWIYKEAPNLFPPELRDEQNWTFQIVCGTGNNGGDGLAIARMLERKGYSVEIQIVHFSDKNSEDFDKNLAQLGKAKKHLSHIRSAEDIKPFEPGQVIIDAIFGTGLSRPVEGIAAEVIQEINKAQTCVVSIDMPSGLFVEDNSENDIDSVIRASHVLSFQNPKLAFFLSDNEPYLGSVHLLDIGLDREKLASIPSKLHMITQEMIAAFLERRSKYSHKGTAGHVIIIGGSNGKWGAPIISAKAALRSGAGLVTVYTGGDGLNLVHSAQLELMVSGDPCPSHISEKPELSNYDIVAIGPGLGTSDEAAQVLKQIIHTATSPLVMDADALNILSENPTWLSFLPAGSILTPHPGEFARLAGEKLNHYGNIKSQLELSAKHGIYIVLKGANTSISTPDGNLFFNSSGNPGMATAGMGDALTGIISSLLAQYKSPLKATLIGVFVHGLAGDLALKKQSHESLITQDLIEHLGRAFQAIRNE